MTGKAGQRRRLGVGVLAAALLLGSLATSVAPAAAEPEPPFPVHPNPTGRLIRPRLGQTADQQRADEQDCFARACVETGWDPYAAYDDLVAAGYAVALDHDERDAGLVCLAADGAVTGAVAGDLLDDPEFGAEIGAAIAVAAAVVRADYLLQPDDPAARRAVTRFERDLKHWERKFAACLRTRGYRVRSF